MSLSRLPLFVFVSSFPSPVVVRRGPREVSEFWIHVLTSPNIIIFVWPTYFQDRSFASSHFRFLSVVDHAVSRESSTSFAFVPQSCSFSLHHFSIGYNTLHTHIPFHDYHSVRGCPTDKLRKFYRRIEKG
jgi:hypothetical protein